MKTICKSPYTGQTSSKRVIALCFGAVAILLAIAYITLFVVLDKVPENMIELITLFTLTSAGNQAMATGKVESSGKIEKESKPKFDMKSLESEN